MLETTADFEVTEFKSSRSDNGPEFVSRRVREFLDRVEIDTSYIEPGSPWQNGYVESFNSRLRDECLACEEFSNVQESKHVITHWRQTYNHRRPHGALSGLTPAEFSSRCAASASVAVLTTLQQHNNPVTQPVAS